MHIFTNLVADQFMPHMQQFSFQLLFLWKPNTFLEVYGLHVVPKK